MNNEVEDIIGLFDEFFIIDGERQETPANEAAAQPASPIKNTPATPVAPAEPEPPVNIAPEPVEQPASKERPVPALHYSGANKKHIAVIYNDKNNDSRENVEMLSNLITKALKFSMDDVAVIRLSRNNNVALDQFFDTLNTKHALLWGAHDLVKQAGVEAVTHTVITIGKTQVMIADFVHEYHGKTEYKGKLWETVQKLFSR
jgi:ethanolamine utilization protein EutP (predicted NTPase)